MIHAAVVVALGGGCARGDGEEAPGPIASALLGLAAELGAEPDQVIAAWQQIGVIAQRVARRPEKDGVDALNAVVFSDLHFAREIEDDDLRFVSLPSVITGRRGSCLGLTALYLAVAERRRLPLDGVLLPGHIYTRAPGPPPRNVELLRRGEAMPDGWYLEKYGSPPRDAGGYGRALSAIELTAVHWFNVGNRLRRLGDLARAEAAYARAAAEFPVFAEAHASLGTVRQLRGDGAGAAAAYDAAARAWPDLPGLEHNRAVLARGAVAPPPSIKEGQR